MRVNIKMQITPSNIQQSIKNSNVNNINQFKFYINNLIELQK